MTDTTQHQAQEQTQEQLMDIPVALTVAPNGRLTVATAQGHIWQWNTKARRWEMFLPVPFTAAAAQLEQLRQAPAHPSEQPVEA